MDGFLNLLRDAASRTVLAVIALCSTILFFFVANWWLKRKSLTFTTSSTRLLTIHEEAKERVKILFDDGPVKDVYLVFVTVTNSGHEPIRSGDFEGPLRIKLGDTAEILTMDVLETKPDNLAPKFSRASANEYGLEPLLLNKGDSLKIKALINVLDPALDQLVTVAGRIVGVKEIRATGVDSMAKEFGAVLLAIVWNAIVISLLLLSLPKLPLTPPFLQLMYVFLASAICGMGCLIFLHPGGWFKRSRSR